MAYDAVLRNPAVIGEAVKSLPDDFKRERPDSPCASIVGVRNVVANEYFRVAAALAIAGWLAPDGQMDRAQRESPMSWPRRWSMASPVAPTEP